VIVVDTSVWSQALRRRRGAPSTDASEPAGAALLRRLIEEGEPVAVPGPVVQELLSGLRSEGQVERLNAVLEPFPTLLATRDTHVLAASVSNACRRRGVACSSLDVLIAALTLERGGILLTADQDFSRIAEHSDLRVQLLPGA
jgi:predicted nucleic acid-binding protein